MLALTEQALSLMIGAIALGYAVQNNNDAIDSVTAQATGQYMSTLHQAENTYVFDNFTALSTSDNTSATMIAGPANNQVSAVVEHPLNPTIDDLKALKLLPIGFNDITPLRLSFATTLTPVNCPSTECVINGIIYSTTPYRDTNGDVREDILTQAVAIAGADAGMSYAESPETITGLGNEWTEPNPVTPLSAGVLAMHVGASSYLGNVVDGLYPRDGSRDLTGDMPANNHSIGNADNVQANGTVQGGQITSTGNVNAIEGVYGSYVQSSGNALVAGNMQSANVLTGQVLATGNVSGQSLSATGSVNTAIGGAFAVENTPCPGELLGAGRSDNTGNLLSCRNDGLWHAVGSAGGAVGAIYQTLDLYGNTVLYSGMCSATQYSQPVGVASAGVDQIFVNPTNFNDQGTDNQSEVPVCPSNMPYFYVMSVDIQSQNVGGGN